MKLSEVPQFLLTAQFASILLNLLPDLILQSFRRRKQSYKPSFLLLVNKISLITPMRNTKPVDLTAEDIEIPYVWLFFLLRKI